MQYNFWAQWTRYVVPRLPSFTENNLNSIIVQVAVRCRVSRSRVWFNELGILQSPSFTTSITSSAGDWTPAYYTVLYYTCIIPYETFYTNGRSDCMYWTPYGTQNLWNKFNIISDPIQCVAIKTAVVFFEKLPKSTILTVINPYQSLNKSPHDRIRNNQGTIGTKTCENGTY